MSPPKEHRPWGYFQVLADEKRFKSKTIVLESGKRLSLQRHRYRDEHWFIVQGAPIVTLGEQDIVLGPGKSLDIPRTVLHRIENPAAEQVIFIEVQTGEYFGEDDIERVEDDFGRV